MNTLLAQNRKKSVGAEIDRHTHTHPHRENQKRTEREREKEKASERERENNKTTKQKKTFAMSTQSGKAPYLKQHVQASQSNIICTNTRSLTVSHWK